MGLFDIEDHLVFYRAYHFNHTNVLIHLFCIPVIFLSTITFLSVKNFFGDDYPYINHGMLLAVSYSIFYILNDWKVGVPTAIATTAYAFFIKHYYMQIDLTSLVTQHEFVKYAIAAHVLSWLAQFYGHGVHEKRAPALLDNLLQALVLAPFFVSFEIAFALGFRLPLKKAMDNRAGKLVLDFKMKEVSKKKSQ